MSLVGAVDLEVDDEEKGLMAGSDAELEAALKAMESSFHVRLIGTFDSDLVWAPADAEALAWLTNYHLDLDQFPVKQGDATVGILFREGDHSSGKTVYDSMQPLREGLVVSADMPITDLIPQLRESHNRLVLRGSCIDGLVTQSDLLKLPVRMLLFGLITHLEICLRALVRERAPWPKWMSLLEPERRKAVTRDLNKLKNARFEPDPLEFTNLSDVLGVLAHQADLAVDFGIETEAIRKLRNEVAHAKTYISSADDFREFVDRFTYIRKWIDCMSRLLKTSE